MGEGDECSHRPKGWGDPGHQMGDAPARWTARLLLLRPKLLKGKVGFLRLRDG